jgi:hypothetical protein
VTRYELSITARDQAGSLARTPSAAASTALGRRIHSLIIVETSDALSTRTADHQRLSEQGKGFDYSYAGWYLQLLGLAEAGWLPIVLTDYTPIASVISHGCSFRHVVEDHADHALATFKTQHEAISPSGRHLGLASINGLASSPRPLRPSTHRASLKSSPVGKVV